MSFAPATPVPTRVPGLILPHNEATANSHANYEKMRMSRPRNRLDLKESDRLKVYIYNVGPPYAFSKSGAPIGITRSCASLGNFHIGFVPEDKILLADDLSVSEPLVIPGKPAEPYPDDGRNKWINHEPEDFIEMEVGGEITPLGELPGYDLALRIIGSHPQSNSDDDLRPRGVFVSPIPEQIKPEEPIRPSGGDVRAMVAFEREYQEYERAEVLYQQWRSLVIEARENLRKWIVGKLTDARERYNRNEFHEVKEDLLYRLGKLTRQSGIDIECPWLKDTTEQSGTVPCVFCGSSIPTKARKCKVCLEFQNESDERAVKKGKRIAAE